MPAPNYDIILEQGVTFRANILYQTSTGGVINVTGYTAKMKIKATPTSATTLVSLSSTSGGGITITSTAGKFALLITAAQTAAVTASPAVYDLIITASSGDLINLLEGSVEVHDVVTV